MISRTLHQHMHVQRQISRSSVYASPPHTVKWMFQDLIKTQHFSSFDPRTQYIPEILCILKYFNFPKHMAYKLYPPSGMFMWFTSILQIQICYIDYTIKMQATLNLSYFQSKQRVAEIVRLQEPFFHCSK